MNDIIFIIDFPAGGNDPLAGKSASGRTTVEADGFHLDDAAREIAERYGVTDPRYAARVRVWRPVFNEHARMSDIEAEPADGTWRATP